MKRVLAFGSLVCALSLAAACTAKTETPPKEDAMVGPSPVEAPAPPPGKSNGADGGAGRSQDMAEVPAAFRGNWDTQASTCGTGISEGKLTIAASRIEFYESGGPVTGVTAKGPNEVAIATTLSGEGETWTDLTTFRLSADGKTITDVSDPNEAHPFVRVRCP